MEITPNFSGEAVSYNGRACIGIRCMAHTGSNVFHLLSNMKRVRFLHEFKGSFQIQKNRKSQSWLLLLMQYPKILIILTE